MSPPDLASAALELIDAATDLLLSAEFWQLSGQVEADLLERAEQISRRLEYGKLLLLADFHRRDVTGEQAGLSSRQFLKSRLHISSAEATRRLHAVRELVPAVSPTGETVQPELPATAVGVASGEISGQQAQIISAAIRRLPTSLEPPVVTEAEDTLAGHARDLDPDELRIVAHQLHLHVNPDGNLPTDQPSRRELTFRRDADGMDILRGRLDAEGSATVQAALAPLMQPRAAEDGVRDPRSPARRCTEALIQLCGQVVSRGDLPTVAGQRPRVTVTMSLADLQAGTGHGTLNTGAPISPESARRIACDASVIPIVLGSRGEPFDIGRQSRTIPPGIRRAVIARDVGCVHLDCDAPAQRCEAHHVQHWANGGPTALDNLVLLCPRHHWTIHHDQWQITFRSGIPYVIRPPLLDPEHRPRRNTRHHLPTVPSGQFRAPVNGPAARPV